MIASRPQGNPNVTPALTTGLHWLLQGVSGTVKDKGSVRRTVPFLAQAVKQGFQDLGAKDLAGARQLLYSGSMKMEGRTQAAQSEGGVHDMLTFEKKPW
jgi:IMP dehydrogenase